MFHEYLGRQAKGRTFVYVNPAFEKVTRSGIAVGFSTLLGFVVMFRSYHYFSFGVSLFKITYGLGNLGERIRSVDDRHDLAGLDELLEELQILLVWFHREASHLLAHEW